MDLSIVIVSYNTKEVLKDCLASVFRQEFSFQVEIIVVDNNSSDGERETFDNLYPTNHFHYGYMDRASLQNLNDYRLTLSAKPTEKLELQSDWHFMYVDTPKDSLYQASRAVLRTASVSDASSHIGNEMDLTAKYKLCSYATLFVGYSHFFAGQFLDDSGNADDADFAYVETTLDF